jgi:ribosomal protein S4
MRRFKKKYLLNKVRKTIVYELENKYLVEFGLRNKKELGRGYLFLKKVRKTYLKKDENKNNYQLLRLSLLKKGILSESQQLLDLKIENFFSRTLQCILSKRNKLTIREARKKITSGLVSIEGRRVRRPLGIIHTDYDEKITLKK